MIPFEREPKRDEHGRSFRPAQGPHGSRSADSVDPALRQDARATADGARAREGRWAARAGWLVGPLILCSIVAAMLFVMRGPDRLFGLAFGLVLALGAGWILVSALFPAQAERTCPECGRASVVRIDKRSLIGLRCRVCTWRDESASAFIQAEDDGIPFEDAVLRDRGRNRRF